MSKKFLLILLLFSINSIGQTKTFSDSNFLTHISRKGIYEIKYNKEHWQKTDITSKWDAEFHDTYNLLNAYFIEYDHFVTDKNIKKRLKRNTVNLVK